jgi:cobalt-zinc-cadmium efflux system outer membrane protein
MPAVLTLHEAFDLYRKYGLDLLIAEASVQSAEGDLTIAGSVPNPTLSGLIGKSYSCPKGGSCQSYGPPAFNVGLSDNNAIEEILSGKRGLKQDVAHAALVAAKQSKADAQRTLGTTVKQQFVQVVLAQETVKLDEDTRATQDKFYALTSNRYRLGAISEADLARVQTATLEAHQAVTSALQSLKQAKAQLAFLLGFRGTLPDFQVEGSAFSHYTAPERFEHATREALLTKAIETRPDLKSVRAQAERAQDSVRLAKRLVFPDIALQLGFLVQGTEAPLAVTPPTFTLGLSVGLPLFYQQQGEIHKADADWQTQELEVRKAEAQVASDVQTAYAGYLGTSELLRTMETGGLLDSARRARDLVSIQYQKGAASLLDFLDAQRTYIAVNVEYRQDVAAYWAAVFQLDQAVGSVEVE